MLQQPKNYFFCFFWGGTSSVTLGVLGKHIVRSTIPCLVPIFRFLTKLWGDGLESTDCQ